MPSALDIALWDSQATAVGDTAGIGAGLSVEGIKLTNPANAVTIGVGTGSLTVGYSGIDLSTSTQNLTITAPLVLSGDQSWTVASGRTMTINSAVTGFNQSSYNLALNGTGNVTLSWNNLTVNNATATGTVTINGGTLTLNATTTSPTLSGVTNMLSPLTPLVVGGGTLAVNTGGSVGLNSQTFNGLTINAGGSAFTMARGSSSNSLVNFGAMTRNVGGTITLSAASTAATGGYRTSTGANGIVGGYATVNGTDFARWTNATTSIVSNSVPTYTNDTWGATNNTTVTANTSQTGATTYSLAFRAASARTLTLSGTNTITTGGLLNSSGVGAFNNVITGGTLRGASGADLIVHQWNTGGTLDIQSVIADNTTATALTKAGTGTLIISGNNTFTGGVYLNAGVLQLGNAGALNSTTPNAVTFNNNSSATLRLAGNSVTVPGLNTSSVVAATAPIIENNNAVAAVLTVNNATANTYAGKIQNGTTGTLGLTKTGAGTLVLLGTNTYTGATTVSNGMLFVGTNINSSTAVTVTSPGILDVTASGWTVGAGNALSGTGSVLGTVTAGSGANLTPGTAGTVGTLTLTNLNLNTGSVFNLDLSGTNGVGDRAAITGALTLQTGINVNLSGAGAGLTGNIYTVLSYGTASGFSPSNFTIASGGFGGLTYTFADTGTAVTLTIGGALAANSTWNVATGGSWATAGNWSPATVPAGLGATANFGSAIGGASTVTLDGSKTVGVLTVSSPSVYTIATGSGGNLIFDNGTSLANLTDSSTPGNSALPGQVISAGVTLNSTTVMTVGSGETLAITGAIGGTGGLTKAGAGTLNLGAVNSYSGPTTLNAGTVNFVSGAVSTSAFTFGGGTLQYATGNTDDLSSGRTVTSAGTAVIDTNGNNVVFANAIGNSGTGGLTKTGAGSLTLASGNTYTGVNTINGGTLIIGDDTALGAVPGSAGTNLTINSGTTLKFRAAATLNANRSIMLAGGTGTIDTNGFNAQINGATSGSGLLRKIGAGTLTITSQSSATGGVTIDAGTIALTGTQTQLPSGTLTLNGTGGIALTANLTSAFSPVVNGTANFITSSNNGQIQQLIAPTGGGTLTFGGGFVNDYLGDWTAFTGTVIASRGGSRWNGSVGGTNLTFDLANTGSGVRSGATGITLGAIAGSSEANLIGGTGGAGQAITYTIGGKTVGGLGVTPVDSTYSGIFSNGTSTSMAITKVGASKLTLNNPLTSTNTGATTISAGVLQLGDGGPDGSLSTSSAIVNNANLMINQNDAVVQGTDFSGLPITGTGSLTQAGSGTTILNVTNTFTGGTTINAGTLQVASVTALSTGNVAVHAGTLQSTVNLTGVGNLTLDNAASVLTGTGQFLLASLKSFTMSAGTWVLNNLSGVLNAFDSVESTGGSFNVTGGTLDLSGSVLTPGTYRILSGFTNSGTTTGFSSITHTGGYSVAFDFTTTPGTGALVVTAVPEPAEYGVALGGLLFLLISIRRRKARLADHK